MRAGAADLPREHRAVFSRLERSGRWELAPRSKVTSIGGTIVLDLGQATLHGAETTLHVRNFFGTITLLVPRRVIVSVDGGGAFGTRDIDCRTPARWPMPRGCGSAPPARSGRCGSGRLSRAVEAL